MKKLVSVIMPVYNNGEFVKQSVSSILNQSYKDLALIVIDSSDDGITTDILRSYRDSRIRYFHQEKNGIANALNFGLENATGTYVARMDADDVSLPDRFRKQVEFLESHPDISVLGTECDVIDSNGNVINTIAPGYYNDSEIKAKLIFENCIMHPSVMMRSELIKDGWRYDPAFCAEDLDLWTRMAASGISFSNLKDRLFFYRKTGENLTVTTPSLSVAISAATSAKNYAESLFEIDKDKYDVENYTRPYYPALIKSSDYIFILNQAKLLNEIYRQNKLLKRIKESDLIKELNSRWQWVYLSYSSIAPFYKKNYGVLPPEGGFFLDSFTDSPDFNSLESFYRDLEEDLTQALEMRNLMLREDVRILLYGLGKVGVRILTELEELVTRKTLNWSLVAVIDKEKRSYKFLGENFATTDANEIDNLVFDFVIISSTKFYDEIKQKLLKKNIHPEKIIPSKIVTRIKNEKS